MREFDEGVYNWSRVQLTAILWTLVAGLRMRVDAARSALALDTLEGGHYVGVHIRRGDACKCAFECCFSNDDGEGRECPHDSAYAKAAIIAARAVGADRVLVATESADALAQVSAILTENGIQAVAVDWERTSHAHATAERSCNDGHERGMFERIETAIDSGALTAETGLISAVIDIELLASAAAIVGSSSSAFSGLAHTLAEARWGRPVPFMDILPSEDDECADCPDCETLADALDFNHDGQLSLCECDVVRRPSRPKMAGINVISKGCVCLANCLDQCPRLSRQCSDGQ